MDKRVIVQFFRVCHLAIDDPSFLQGFPDGDRVDVVKTVLFFFGIEPVLLNKLGKPALYLGPRQLHFLRAAGTDNKQAVTAAVFLSQPCGGVFLPCMVLHIADNGVFTLDIAVPCTKGRINIFLRERTQQLMEFGIGFVCHFPVQPLAKLRHIREQADQLYIVGIKNGAAHSSITLDHSVFIITMAAGVAVSGVLGNSFHHDGLVFLIQFPNRRGCLFRLHIPEHSGSICAKLCFLSIDVLFCLMVDGEHGILLTLSAALRDSGNSYIMLIPQMFYNLLQPVCRKAAHFHTATAGDSAGREMEVQLRSGSFGIFTIQFKEIAHLIENYVIRVTLLDPVVFPYLRGRLLGLQGIFFGQRFFCLDFVILRLFLFSEIASLLNQAG
ncbi:Beta-methylgalactoside transporter inner membrane component, partial [Dysosmobacter welbionis]